MRNEKGQFVKGAVGEFLGKTHSQKAKAINSLKHLGPHKEGCGCPFCKSKRGEHVGEKHPYFQKKRSLIAIEKNRLGHIGLKHSDDTKRKMSEAHSKEKHWNWKGGASYEKYSVNFDNQLKDRIRVRDNFKCQLCGVPELETGRKMSVHHIDYNKHNYNDNNLICLCVSCHMKTNFHRVDWLTYFLQKEINSNGT